MGEILGQVLVAREHLGDDRPEWPMLRNIVFMGMGEPLLNMRELMRSLEGLNNDKGLNFSPRRMITRWPKVFPALKKRTHTAQNLCYAKMRAG